MRRLLNLLFSFRKSINRKQFLLGYIIDIIVVILALYLSSLAETFPNKALVITLSVVSLGIMLVAIISLVAITIKRLRHMHWTPWLVLLGLIPLHLNIPIHSVMILHIPIISTLLVIFCIFYPGKKPNAGKVK